MVDKRGILPTLKKVAMSTSRNQNGQRLHYAMRHDVEWLLAAYSRLSLPLFFLDHPPVKHFCQFNLLGTLALPSGYIEVSPRPEVVTHHMPPEHLTHFPQRPPPVVLGTVNRYYFPHSTLFLCLPGQDEYALVQEDVLPLFGPLMPFFDRARPRIVSDKGSSYKIQGGGQKKGWLEGTTVELYGFVQSYTLSRQQEARYRMRTWDPTAAAAKAKPESLRRVQKGLEMILPEWKGHVILKHREEAPGCTACGLDFNEQRRKTPEGGKWYVPS